MLAYGQVVATLTTMPDVYGVRFVRDGQPLAVPRDDGSLSTSALTQLDYADLLQAG